MSESSLQSSPRRAKFGGARLVDRGSGETRRTAWELRPDGTQDSRGVRTESDYAILELFSWPELVFPTRSKFKLSNNPEITKEAQFIEKRTGDDDILIGYMGRILDSRRYKDREPLKLAIIFQTEIETRRKSVIRRGSGEFHAGE